MPYVSCVRVTCVPSGEAPEEDRREWVGIVIPLLYEEPVEAASLGLMTGKSEGTRTGWVVPALLAFCLLMRKSPRAAGWWFDLKRWESDDALMFGVGEGEHVEVEEDEVRNWMMDAVIPLAIRTSYREDLA